MGYVSMGPIKTYSSRKEILMFPDDYIAHPHTFEQNDPRAITTSTGRRIVQAGTIWPANDATAKGVVFYDCDVTYGTATGAILFQASIKVNKLPTVPTAEAVAALKRITFFEDTDTGNADEGGIIPPTYPTA